ncbi:MAG: hypothetical protein AB7O66_10515 [Limisphaerales bacterium]
MSTLGTIALALAVPIYLIVLHALFTAPRRFSSDADRVVGDGQILASLGFLILWFCLAIAFASAILSGRFDWLARTRTIQFILILAAHAATGFITWASILRRNHPPDSIPVGLRLFLPRAALILPPVVLLVALFALHPPLGYEVPPGWIRVALNSVGIVSILVAAALLIEGGISRSGPPPS